MANPKKIIKGAQKAVKLTKRINNARDKKRGLGFAEVNAKGKLEVRENVTSQRAKIKGKIKDINKNAQLEYINMFRPVGAAKITSLIYPPKNLKVSKSRTPKSTTPKVPVKKRGK